MARVHRRFTAVSLLSMLLSTTAFAQENADNLLDMSLDQLTNLEVTSVSKKAEKANEAAAAIYVITQEDIKRSGAIAIPELLRMVPGINVARAGAHDWAVSSRGFNDQFSNKLLVLIDGRTVYSPLFSGVWWDAQDTVMEDIDRIEVIRGPGATLFGANAVNGVINIITKSAERTQGGLVTASAGNQVNGIGEARYGGKVAENSYLRAYAKYTNNDSEFRANGSDANDSWRKRQAGFRSDLNLTEIDNLTVQGDVYTVDNDADFGFPDVTSPTLSNTSSGMKARGGNILARWEQKNSKDSTTTLQLYFDNAERETSFFNDATDTADADFQHVWTGWNRQEIVWGVGYRYMHNTNEPASQQYGLIPQTRNDNLFNTFIQDKIALVPDEVFLTLGSKFEYNDYTGVEVQPSARMTWLVADNQTLWGSVSRAVHTPSRFTEDGYLAVAAIPPGFPPSFAPLPVLVSASGNDAVDSEELIAYELGYRIQPMKTLSFDVAGFYNDYDKLFSAVPGTPVVMGTSIFQPLLAANLNSAKSYGIELSTKWDISPQWQVAGAYSYLNLQFDDKTTGGFYSAIGKQPKNTFNIRSTYLFPHNIEMTNALYYVDDLTALGIPSYYRFDTKISYAISNAVELSLIGQNLLHDQHPEFSPFVYNTAAEIGRSVYGKITWRF